MDSKKKLSENEKDLAEAEELKSLKPAEIMEALAKRKVERENKEWYEKFRWFTSFRWLFGGCRQRHR